MHESPLNVPKAAWRQNEELDIFADAVGQFFEKECVPHVQSWRKAGVVPRDIWKKREEGLWQPVIVKAPSTIPMVSPLRNLWKRRLRRAVCWAMQKERN